VSTHGIHAQAGTRQWRGYRPAIDDDVRVVPLMPKDETAARRGRWCYGKLRTRQQRDLAVRPVSTLCWLVRNVQGLGGTPCPHGMTILKHRRRAAGLGRGRMWSHERAEQQQRGPAVLP
jgi:hypothetical protein